MGIVGVFFVVAGIAFLVGAAMLKDIGAGLIGVLLLSAGIAVLVYVNKLSAGFNRLGEKLNIRVPIGGISASVGDLFIIYLSEPLFFIEAGKSVRPMEAFVLSFLIAILVSIVSLPLVYLIDKRISRRWEIFGKVVCLFPFPYIFVGWEVIALIRGFSFSP